MKLEELRKEIDEIDRQWIDLLSKRISIAKQIALVKQQQKLSLYDQKREKQMKEEGCMFAKKRNLQPQFIDELFDRILAYTKQEMQKESIS